MNNSETTGVVIEVLDHLPCGSTRVLLDTGFDVVIPGHVDQFDTIMNGEIVEQRISPAD